MVQEYLNSVLPQKSQKYFWVLAWPAILEYVLVSMIGFFDTVMVSEVGIDAIAAVGLAVQPKNIMTSFAQALSVGVMAVVARREGEGRRRTAIITLQQSLVVGVVLVCLVNGAGIMFAQPIMRIAGAQAHVMDTAVLYLRVVFFANVFHGIALIINAAQRGVGNTKISFETNVSANIVNVIFNYLLIGGRFGFPELGVLGAGIATVLGSATALGMAVFSVSRSGAKLNIRSVRAWKPQGAVMRSVASVSSGSALEQVFLRIGTFTFACIIGHLGTNVFSAHNIAMNVTSISFSIGDGVGAAAAALVGQNLGAGDKKGAYQYARYSQLVAGGLSLVLAGIVLIFHVQIIDLFARGNEEIHQLCKPLFFLLAINIMLQITSVSIAGALRGAGDVRYVAKITFIGLTLIRPVLGWLLCTPCQLGLVGAWLGMAADQLTRRLLLQRRFRGGTWSEKKL